MTPERWALVQDRLHQALEADAATRAALLQRIGAEDPDLAAEVRSLLDAADSGPLGPEPVPPTAELVAEYVGPYRLLSRLGEGGMGTVYLAQREEAGFEQRVALKLLRVGLPGDWLSQYVEHERRILARLEHPNIARLIDGGAAPSGQPYLAMEYVEGGTLVEHCAKEQLSTTARLRLFIEVCEAVHYAHQQLVVHRDLKPTNVMVGRDGRPRLLDFGISKLLDPDRDGAQTVTSPWLTPAYASPEQVRGGGISTLADVYALGVMLYELLAGVRPYDVEGRSPAEMEHLVCEIEPPRPSERCADPKVARLLRGDLDLIILKALAKEPARRYHSAEQLAIDLRRYLEGRPVEARPDDLAYRASKFVRRHRTAVTAAAAIMVMLAVAVGVVVRQAEIAQRERDAAERAERQSKDVTAFLVGLFEGANPERSTVDTAVARALIRRGIAEAEALSGQPLVQASMFDALGMVFVTANQFEQAADLVSRGLALRQASLPPDHPDIASSLAHLGRIFRGQSLYQEALERYQEALAIRLQALGPQHPDVASSYRDLGFLMPYLARNEESARYYRDALAIDQVALGEEHAQTAEDIALVGLALRRLGQWDEAIDHLTEAVDRKVRALGPNDPTVAITKFHLADVLADDGQTEPAERLYREGIATRRQALGPEDLGQVHGLENLSSMLGRQGKSGEAESLLREAVALRRSRLGERAPGYAHSLELLSDELARQGRYPEAIALRREGLSISLQSFGTEHTAVAGSFASMAGLLRVSGDLAEAEQFGREALAIRLRLFGPKHALVGLSHVELGQVLARRRVFAEAESEILTGLEILVAGQPPGHEDRQRAYAALADLHDQMGRPAEAERVRKRANEDSDPPKTP